MPFFHKLVLSRLTKPHVFLIGLYDYIINWSDSPAKTVAGAEGLKFWRYEKLKLQQDNVQKNTESVTLTRYFYPNISG